MREKFIRKFENYEKYNYKRIISENCEKIIEIIYLEIYHVSDIIIIKRCYRTP